VSASATPASGAIAGLRGPRKLQALLEGVAVEEIEESFIGLILDVDRMKMNCDPHCPILDNEAIDNIALYGPINM
jgi:hypothetical protein